MKLVCKTFIILGMVVGFWTIVPIVVGVIALNKLENAKTKNELTGTAICTILFCNTVAGILMLCMNDEELQKNTTQSNQESTFFAETKAENQGQIDEISKKIEKLKQLKEQGILSEEEFETLRKKEVDKMLGGDL